MKTDTFVLTTTPRQIKALSSTKCVRIGEDDSAGPTVDFQVRKPFGSDNPRTIRMGQIYEFRRADGSWYLANDHVGYINTASGSSTFYQDEE